MPGPGIAYCDTFVFGEGGAVSGRGGGGELIRTDAPGLLFREGESLWAYFEGGVLQAIRSVVIQGVWPVGAEAGRRAFTGKI